MPFHSLSYNLLTEITPRPATLCYKGTKRKGEIREIEITCANWSSKDPYNLLDTFQKP